jgi:hypothetical protein
MHADVRRWRTGDSDKLKYRETAEISTLRMILGKYIGKVGGSGVSMSFTARGP